MEFVLLGLLVLSFPIIAIVALVETINISDRLRAGATLRRLRTAAGAPAQRRRLCNRPPRSRATAPIPSPNMFPHRKQPQRRLQRPRLQRRRRSSRRNWARSASKKIRHRWTVWIGGVALALRRHLPGEIFHRGRLIGRGCGCSSARCSPPR
jgi:uncharacterized membrane protein